MDTTAGKLLIASARLIDPNFIHSIVLMVQHDDLLHLPLHRQVIPWAALKNVTAVHRADNNVIPYWVKIEESKEP